jgi:hypothetical protein
MAVLKGKRQLDSWGTMMINHQICYHDDAHGITNHAAGLIGTSERWTVRPARRFNSINSSLQKVSLSDGFSSW